LSKVSLQDECKLYANEKQNNSVSKSENSDLSQNNTVLSFNAVKKLSPIIKKETIHALNDDYIAISASNINHESEISTVSNEVLNLKSAATKTPETNSILNLERINSEKNN